MIHKEDIDKIFEAARVEEVVADYVTLKKRGVNLIGLCPFHDEKTPSFYVSPAKGIYKCFGCGKGGHAINFLMDKEQLSYPDALRSLAKKYNIRITEEEQSPEQLQTQNDRESLLVVSSYAQKHFSENLYNTDEGKSVGLGYFKERGFREDIIQKFQLGYSINHRTVFTDIALATGYKMDYLVKSGLTIEYKNENQTEKNTEEQENVAETKQENKYLDRFWGRVMFPIHNVTGRVIAFGGRTLRTDTKKIAKYINSPETEIYHKSDVLYGIYFAKKEIINQDNCFLVEGYTDVISMHQAGIENVVASSGTSLTHGQIKLINRFTKNITILYDGDNAGIKASFRGIDLILEEGMNVKVLLFPDGEDPDSYSKRVSSEELKSFIKNNSKDFISFKTNLLMGDVQNDPIKKAGLIKEIVESIALIPEAIYRSVYVKECSRIMDVEEQILLNELNKIRSKKFNEKRNQSNSENLSSEENLGSEVAALEEKKENAIADAEHQERDIIRILINYGNKNLFIDSDEKDERGKAVQIEVSVAQLIIHELQHDNIVLDNLLYNSIYNEFVQHLEKDTVPDFNYFVSHENVAICGLTIDLISSPYLLSDWEKHSIYITKEENILKKSLENAVYALKSRRLEMMIHDIQKRLKENPPEEELMTLMPQLYALLEAKKTFNALLGRIVVK
ncbi:MAG: DNA primase [Bacteroidetes bacterium RIFCSPLOWO2_12_FULL_35_15]|nr:MAG: DNA primase [Bacteroidetes bacterium RIFCSPLOWO2_12_FULL_35_15]